MKMDDPGHGKSGICSHMRACRRSTAIYLNSVYNQMAWL
jgi:hypothetical protein